MSQLLDVRGLFFDVFGTCVDWRSTVEDALRNAARDAVSSGAEALSASVKDNAAKMTDERWADFAQEWRSSYLKFTRNIASNPDMKFKTVDQHHLDSLYELLQGNGLLVGSSTTTGEISAGKGSIWTDEEIHDLSLIWHRLTPWPDTCDGLRELNKHYQTSTLTNGNLTLIKNMVAHGDMPFTHVLSAELFNSYKPNPAVYLGAAKRLGLEPSQCAMVAAHLDDLVGARKCGFRTIYVERPQEEQRPELKQQPDLIDLWIPEGDEGFVAVARQLESSR